MTYLLRSVVTIIDVFYKYTKQDEECGTLSKDELKELLEKLDLVSAMRSSGARTRRVRMLRREINVLRQKLAQPPPPQLLSLNKTVPNGDVPAGSRGDAGAAGLDQALQEEPEDEGNRGERV